MQAYYEKIQKSAEESEKSWQARVCEADLKRFAEIQDTAPAWEYWD